MRAAGIDPSLSAFTIAAGEVHGNLPALVRFELVPALPPSNVLEDRIARYEALGEAAAERLLILRPELVLLEGYSYNSRGSVVQLGECGGLVRRAILDASYDRRNARQRFRVLEIAPAMLKRFACGKGNGKKAAIGSALAARYGQTFETDDQADAYGLLRLALIVLAAAPPTTATERDVALEIRAVLEGRAPTKKPKKKRPAAA